MAEAKSKLALSLKDERRLIKRLKSGDRAAFHTLYEAFAQDLYSCVIFPKVPIRDVAEDILRDTFLTALERIGRFRWQGRSIRYWLRRIAANKVIDYHRANQRATRFAQGYQQYVKETDVRTDPERELSEVQWQSHLKERVTELIDELNPRYQLAIRLRFFEERSRQQCADTLEVSVSTFDVVLFRALKRLRQLYERRHGTVKNDA